MTDDYVVVVHHRGLHASFAIDPEISEDYFDDDVEPDPSSADYDASESVGDALWYALNALEISPVRCLTDGQRLPVCSGLWVCKGPPPHDVEIGLLGLTP